MSLLAVLSWSIFWCLHLIHLRSRSDSIFIVIYIVHTFVLSGYRTGADSRFVNPSDSVVDTHLKRAAYKVSSPSHILNAEEELLI